MVRELELKSEDPGFDHFLPLPPKKTPKHNVLKQLTDARCLWFGRCGNVSDAGVKASVSTNDDRVSSSSLARVDVVFAEQTALLSLSF